MSAEQDSQLSRDGFIELLIKELQFQKQSQGNSDGFFTGIAATDVSDIPISSAMDIFQKLCYDYPLISNYDFRSFLEELGLYRQGKAEPIFQHYFNLNNIRFLSNLSYFVFHENDENHNSLAEISIIKGKAGDTKNQLIGKSRKEILSSFLQEIFFEFPLFILKETNQSRLCNLLSPLNEENESIFEYFSIIKERTRKEEKELSSSSTSSLSSSFFCLHHYKWNELFQMYHQFILQGNSSLLITGMNFRIEAGESTFSMTDRFASIPSMLSVIKLFVDIGTSPSAKSLSSSTLKISEKEITNLSDYLFSLELLSSDNQIVYSNCKDIINHLSFVFIDLLCHFPELFPIYFPKLSEILIQPYLQSHTSSVSPSPFSSFLFFLLLSMLKNLSVFITNEEDYHLSSIVDGSASTTSKISTTKKEIAVDKKSSEKEEVTIEGKKTEKNKKKITTPQSLKVIKETIRKFLISNDHLSLFISYLESSLPSSTPDSNIADVTDNEIEVYGYFTELAELLIGGTRIVSSLTKSTFSALITSRLLYHLLMIYQKIISIYLVQLRRPSEYSSSSSKNSAVLWNLSVK
jgi:hypothetical protein